ncbi:hypothetical protein EMCRGX_G016379 [Ephydatia muelleri]
MLGYSSAANATRAAYFGQGVGPVWLDEVLCSGGEQSLLECSHSEVGAHNCRHSEDAGVICSICPTFNMANVTVLIKFH